ncbi:hypothetical protein RFI_35386, partial [Reticulomyxa filosa]
MGEIRSQIEEKIFIIMNSVVLCCCKLFDLNFKTYIELSSLNQHWHYQMKIPVEDLIVYFPYDYVYPEQYDYMVALKQTLDTGNGHCLLEMPTGTGKTVTLLSLIVSYQLSRPDIGKLVYCTRTVQEMDKVMEEIKRVFSYINAVFPKTNEQKKSDASTNSTISSDRKMDVDIEDIVYDPMMQTLTSKSLFPDEKRAIRKNLCVCLSARRNLCIHPE